MLVLLPAFLFGQANKLYRQALRTTDIQERIGLLDQVIALESNNLDAYFYRGLAKNDLGDYQGAIIDYSKILIKEPDADTYFNRGNSRYNLQDLEGAKADYAMAVASDKSFIDAQYSLACAQYDLGEYEDAIKTFSSVLQLVPDLQIAYTLRASAYFALKDYKNALKDYSNAILARPDSDAFYNRGVYFLDIKYYDRAKSDLNVAIRLDKENPFKYFHRGAANLFLGKFDDAIDDFSKSLEFDALDFDAMLGLAMTYLKLNNMEMATIYFDKAKSIVAEGSSENDLDIFDKSYWYSKHYFYFQNTISELLN